MYKVSKTYLFVNGQAVNKHDVAKLFFDMINF